VVVLKGPSQQALGGATLRGLLPCKDRGIRSYILHQKTYDGIMKIIGDFSEKVTP
jgi:hypothetical protein